MIFEETSPVLRVLSGRYTLIVLKRNGRAMTALVENTFTKKQHNATHSHMKEILKYKFITKLESDDLYDRYGIKQTEDVATD